MGQTNWREQTPPAARQAYLRVLGPWVSASLELRRSGLWRPTVDRPSMIRIADRQLEPETRQAA